MTDNSSSSGVTSLRAILLVFVAAFSFILFLVAKSIYAMFPPSWDASCGGNSDCIGWGLITIMPLYYALKVLFFVAAPVIVSLPILLCFILNKKDVDSGKKSSSKAGSDNLLNRIKDGVGPDA